MAKHLRRTKGKAVPIVGIGASEGGLEAFRQLLKKLPADTGMAFVFVQHLDPTHASRLAELLSRSTKLSVFEARNRMVVKPNRVYVVPSDKNMAIVGRVLKLTQRILGPAHNGPIDLLGVTSRNGNLQKAEVARDLLNAIVETIREPLLVLNQRLRVQAANRAFHQVFQLTKEEIEGKFIYHIDGKQWNVPSLREVLEDILPRNSHLTDFEVDHVFPRIGRRIMLLNARRLERDGADTHMILLAIEDVTERRTLEKAVLDVSEAEQQRIGRDLHDGLGQHLTGISFISESLEDRLAAKAWPEAAALAAKVTTHIREAVTQTRDLAKGLFPVELKTHGIAPALLKLAANTEKMFPIACDFKTEAGLRVRNESVARHLYRIAHEAVFNAVKHSQGKHIHIRLTGKGERVTLMIEDDGVGINTQKVNDSDMGLHIMRYRARAINATLDIQRGPRGGTTVTCVAEDTDGKRGVHEKSKQAK